jgi:uncharacterized protein YbaR (Trm112 family)
MEVGLMMKCREASMFLSTSEPPATAGKRWAMRLHLVVCPDCRAFRRQIEQLAALAQRADVEFEGELSTDFENTLVRRLTDHRSSN